MNQPTPAIVPQSAVRPLSRWALLLLCLAYVVSGFVGRTPWKSADVAAFGYMHSLAQGQTSWLAPLLGGMPPETDGLLPYWLGALAIQGIPALSPDVAARIPFTLLLAITLAATWYGVYYLARSPGAQPVAFAFGGEAQPLDYARTMGDAALLALIACLGLAQLSHETTSYLVQLCATALTFFGLAALPYRTVAPAMALAAGLFGLTLAGAPALAAIMGLGGMLLVWCAPASETDQRRPWLAALALMTLGLAALAWQLDLWRWRIATLEASGKDWGSFLRLLVWFGWPAWPLALWTLWRWRRQILSPRGHRHLWLPLGITALSVGATALTQPADRALLLGLPAMAALAAFALPTLRRSVSALIDWFTLIFFSVSSLAVWIIWLAMQTGVPAKPAANVAKLAPGFTPSFSLAALLAALMATAAWCGLVWWRAARNRAPLWKSLVLPAGGATLVWLLLMTLWLPLLDFARSYEPQMQNIRRAMGPEARCVQTYALSRAQIAALQYHAGLTVEPHASATCPWMLADHASWQAQTTARQTLPAGIWESIAIIPRPTDKNDHIIILRRAGTTH